jgi:hypothetical protein
MVIVGTKHKTFTEVGKMDDESEAEVVESPHDSANIAPRRARAITTGPDLAARLARVTPGIVEAVEAGNFPSVAAQAQGVPLRTWQQWRQWADQGDLDCLAIFEAVDCALANAEIALVAKLANPLIDGMGKADTGYIKATQFLLERTRRERWGDKIEVRLKVEDSMREYIDELEQRMTPEAFDELVIAMSEITAERGEG